MALAALRLALFLLPSMHPALSATPPPSPVAVRVQGLL